MKKPNFFIVGAPKCGTSAMYEYLKQHTEVFMSEEKEPEHFSKDISFFDEYNYRDKKKYYALFKNVKDEKIIGEASTFYLFSKVAAKLIKKECGNVKILIMLRNPVDMLPSLHSQYYFQGNEDIEDFEEALKAEPFRKEGKKLPSVTEAIERLYYSDVAMYYEQVKRFLDVFGRKNVKIILQDEFQKNNEGIFRDLLNFLGVDNKFKPEFKIINPNTRVKSKFFRNILRDFREKPKIIQKIVKKVIPLSLRNKIRAMNTVYEKRKPINNKLRRELMNKFRPDIKKLEKLINKDLGFWYE